MRHAYRAWNATIETKTAYVLTYAVRVQHVCGTYAAHMLICGRLDFIRLVLPVIMGLTGEAGVVLVAPAHL